MHRGFIYIWRKIFDEPFYRMPYCCHLAVHLILRANHKATSVFFNERYVELQRGQLITGREALARETGLTIQIVRTALKRLEKMEFLTICPTSHYSIITICNYDIYQNKENVVNQLSNQLLTNEQPAVNQQLTTDNNVNNELITKNKHLISVSEEIYEKYSRDIRSGRKEESLGLIMELLKNGMDKDYLIGTVISYKEEIEKNGIEEKFRCKAISFFGENARYKDYDPKPVVEYKDPDPDCNICNGHGKVLSGPEEQLQICKCRYLEPVI